MSHLILGTFLVAMLGGFSVAHAQQTPAPPGAAAQQPFVAGEPLKMTPNART